VRVQASWFVYFIDADTAPQGELRKRLLAVLEAKDAKPEPATLWVVPRLGTISPWSSKATDICTAPVSTSAVSNAAWPGRLRAARAGGARYMRRSWRYCTTR
jgi:hypothetical protein